jgi:hypothetical protein
MEITSTFCADQNSKDGIVSKKGWWQGERVGAMVRLNLWQVQVYARARDDVSSAIVNISPSPAIGSTRMNLQSVQNINLEENSLIPWYRVRKALSQRRKEDSSDNGRVTEHSADQYKTRNSRGSISHNPSLCLSRDYSAAPISKSYVSSIHDPGLIRCLIRYAGNQRGNSPC